MEETISLKQFLMTIRKRLGLIFVISLLAAIASGIITIFFITPIYQASTQILVNQSKNEQSMYNYNEVQTNLQLVNTYSVIIKSPAILEKVARELDMDISASQLNEKITVQSEKSSQVVSVSVLDPDPYTASEIANKTVEVFQRDIVKIMNVDNVSILAKAAVAGEPAPVKPKLFVNIGIALIVGLMSGVGLAFLLEYLDNTIKTEQDIEKHLQLPVLGVIGAIKEEKPAKLKKLKKAELRGETVGS